VLALDTAICQPARASRRICRNGSRVSGG
jgi:hypothetical protein